MKQLIFLCLLLLSITLHGQNIIFSFSGTNSNTGNPISVDKVEIFNESNGTDTVITGDTFSTLITGIEINEYLNSNLIILYPNPFNKEVRVSVKTNKKEETRLAIYTVNGKLVSEWIGLMGNGETEFLFESSVKGLLFLAVNSQHINSYTKLLCMEESGSSQLELLCFNSYQEKSSSVSTSNGFSYSLGDNLKFVGYSGILTSEIIYDSPESNKSYSFIFDVSDFVPQADFYTTITNINQGDSVTFYDQSTNSPTNWKWDFGDDKTSSDQNPTHQFKTTGFYTVELISTNSFGSDTITKSDYIEVLSEENILSTTPVSLYFGATETQKIFDITNSGNGTLIWSIYESIDWLILDVTSGITETETDQITVTIDRNGLDPGSYDGTITVTSDGGNQDISVTIEVPEEPILSVTSFSLDFGTSTTELTFDITNTGTGTLDWNISENIGWMTLSTSSGSTTTETDQVTATIDRSSLDPGSYNGTITISSDGGNQEIAVTMEVPEQLSVKTYSSTNITSNSATLNGEITNEGESTVTARGFYWSNTSNDPGTGDNIENAGSGTGTFSATLTELESNTEYYVRTFATNAEGTAYGNTIAFRTNSIELAINFTEPSSNITVTQGEKVTISWTGSGEKAEMVELQIDNDTIWGNNDNEIQIAIFQPNTGIYSLNTSEISTGTYYIGGKITDSTNYLYNYAPGRVTIEELGINETGEFTDSRDDNTYKWIKIGEQIWMAENLAYLPKVAPEYDGSLYIPLYYVYAYQGRDVAEAKATSYYSDFGVFYNWAAAMAEENSSNTNPSEVKGICPNGWHLPSASEWTQLLDYLISNGYNYDGSTSGNKAGKSVASKNNWLYSYTLGSPGNNSSTNNSSGFNGLPGGYKYSGSAFYNFQLESYWWSSTEESSYRAFSSRINYENVEFDPTYNNYKKSGNYIRCIKDQ